jgi:hypothetical protein
MDMLPTGNSALSVKLVSGIGENVHHHGAILRNARKKS